MSTRVVMVTAAYHPIVGGAEKQVRTLSRALTQSDGDISIRIVTGRQKGLPSGRVEIDGLRVDRLGFLDPLKIGILKHIYFGARLRGFLHRIKNEIDLVHVHVGKVPAYSACRACKSLRIPVITKIANTAALMDLARLAVEYPGGEKMSNYLVENLDRVVATTAWMERDLLDYGFSRERVVRIPNGVARPPEEEEAIEVDLRAELDAGEQPIVLFCGKNHPHKNLPVLLDAWMEIDATLVLIGAKEHAPLLEADLARRDLTQKTRVVPFADDLGRFLRGCDLFILPSDCEGLANVLLEAGVRGVPSVVSRVSGSAELVQEPEPDRPVAAGTFRRAPGGWLVEPGDMEGLRAAIQEALGHPEARREAGDALRTFVERGYLIDAVASRYRDLYKELLEERERS